MSSPHPRPPPVLPLLVLLALLSAPTLHALDFLTPYETENITLGDSAALSFTIDLPTRSARLALRITDPVAISPNSTATWIGLGVSEPGSGSMLGADVVTAEFRTTGNNTDCIFTDRYVPFYAFPLIESTADAPGAFPLPDDCQDDGSWLMVRCERDVQGGEMVLEVSRSLDAHDTQDREIVPGLNSMIYAYGGDFRYHQERRGSQKVILFESAEGPSVAESLELPDDVDGSFTILATNFTVPSAQRTIYACTSSVVELGESGRRMIVAAEPVLDSPVDMVHHFTLYLCSGEAYAARIRETVECQTGNSTEFGPLTNPEAICHTFVFGYARGISRLVLPREAGILVNADRPFLVLETHFDNPVPIEGNVDNSGVRLYYTETLRDNEAASLLVGDHTVARAGMTVQNGFLYQHTCPSECTTRFNRTINIYSSVLHMHTTGMEIYTNKFSENGTFVENVGKVNFWSDRFQQSTTISPPITLAPGEQLQTSCIYDTRKRPDTQWGLETPNEMCMNFLAYYPAQPDPATRGIGEINMCSFGLDFETGESLTYCGDNGLLTDMSLLPEQNPKFNDTVRAETTFGNTQATCRATEASPAASPSVSAPALPSAGATEPGSSGAGAAGSASPSVTASVSMLPSMEVSAEVSEEGEVDEDNVCFPGAAEVELRDGRLRRMDEVQVGDVVLVGEGEYSRVVMFTHRERERWTWFVRVETEGGKVIWATKGHWVYVNGGMGELGGVRVGDEVRVVGGSGWERVVSVGGGVRRGVWNLQTEKGDVVVGGVVASTYTRAVGVGGGHALLAPVRWVGKVGFGVDSAVGEWLSCWF